MKFFRCPARCCSDHLTAQIRAALFFRQPPASPAVLPGDLQRLEVPAEADDCAAVIAELKVLAPGDGNCRCRSNTLVEEHQRRRQHQAL
jgi:hypothetical protein